MSKGQKLQRKLKKKFIRRFGINTVRKRYISGSESLNKYGEPVDGTWLFSETAIKIVIDTDKRQVEETLVGGLPDDDTKEILYFYCAGDVDIQIGDKIIYPPSTENEWIVYFLVPNMLGDVDVINEIKCHKDRRY